MQPTWSLSADEARERELNQIRLPPSDYIGSPSINNLLYDLRKLDWQWIQTPAMQQYLEERRISSSAEQLLANAYSLISRGYIVMRMNGDTPAVASWQKASARDLLTDLIDHWRERSNLAILTGIRSELADRN